MVESQIGPATTIDIGQKAEWLMLELCPYSGVLRKASIDERLRQRYCIDPTLGFMGF